MTPRAAALTTLLVLLTLLVAGIAVFIPWRSGINATPSQTVHADASYDFSQQEIAAGDELSARLRVPGLVGLAVGIGVVCALGFWALGARLVERVTDPMGGAWWLQVLVGGLVVLLVVRLATLPFAAWSQSIQQDVGLSTQSWWSWFVDVAKGFAVNSALTLAALFALVLLARLMPRWWWTVGAVGAALLVIVVSFAYPLVIEPIFNHFTPLEQGPLRTSLLDMAKRDGLAVDDVLVADASRRTTTLNAYVSGFGSSRRIVLYDTLLEQAPPDEIRNVVAHELGHVKNNDVLVGTALGALGAAIAVVGLALLLMWAPLPRHAGVAGMADGRIIALLLALLAVMSLLIAPVQNLLSRRIEARADLHALVLTRDPQTLTQMQRRLALTSKSDVTPNPLLFAWFATHPSTPQRMAMARTWADVNGVPIPPPLAPTSSGNQPSGAQG